MVVKIILCVCVACIIGLIAFQFIDPNLNSNNNTTLVDDPNRLSIGISGEVSKPGDYVFDSSPTMEDLIGAAGLVGAALAARKIAALRKQQQKHPGLRGKLQAIINRLKSKLHK